MEFSVDTRSLFYKQKESSTIIWPKIYFLWFPYSKILEKYALYLSENTYIIENYLIVRYEANVQIQEQHDLSLMFANISAPSGNFFMVLPLRLTFTAKFNIGCSHKPIQAWCPFYGT